MVTAYLCVLIDCSSKKIIKVDAYSQPAHNLSGRSMDMCYGTLLSVEGNDMHQALQNARSACQRYFPHLAELLPS